MLRKLVWFLLIAGAGLYALQRWGSLIPNPLKQMNGRLETVVTSVLSRNGLHDRDILETSHVEKGWGPLRWVQTRRTIQASADTQVRVEEHFVAVSKKHGFVLLKRAGKQGQSRLQLKKWFLVTQELLWNKPKASVSLPARAPLKKPRAAIVIDDVGYDLETMDRYAALGVPLTFAILPGDRRARALSEKAHGFGFPVILHLPLQPRDMKNNNPGGAGLMMDMDEDTMRQQFEKSVSQVPHLVGINNHMGSAFTENEELMARLLTWVKARELFFLDSRTTAKSIIPKVARRLEVPCLINHTFLDNADDQEAIEKQLEKAMTLALRYHQTVAIGHYRRKHLLGALEVKIPEFKARGIELVGLPELLKR